jgi:hydroxyacylglutathione hydrolase
MLTVQAFTFNPVQENTYVLYNEKKECCIIDPGCYFASEEQQLTDFITQSGLKPVLLLNTHCHLDHIFGNRFVHKKYGLSLHLHRLEEPVLQYGPTSGQMWQLPFDNYDGELIFLEEGDVVRLGDDELHVLFTPGHSPGSISFYHKEGKFVIAGDVLFQGSVGRTDLPGGSFTILEESIRTKLYTLPQDVIVYSGHGGSTTIGDEMKDNPYVSMV